MAVIVILGMHRSGTSMLARALAQLGADPGRGVLREPSADNALGYWENAGLVALQDRLLAELDRPALTPRAVLPLPPDWLDSAAARAAEAALAALLREELAARANPAAPLLLKDPRTPPLLPLWDRVLARLGEEARFVLALRHPAAVHASLARRKAISPVGAEALWLRHHAEIIRHAGDRLAVVAEYDRVLAAPEAELTRIARRLGLRAPEPRQVPELIRQDLRHQQPGTTQLPLAEATWQALREGREPPSMAEFETTMGFLAGVPGWLDHALSETRRLALGFPTPGEPGRTLRHGNPWCQPFANGFRLHANAPGEPPPGLRWDDLPIGAPNAWFRATLATPPGAQPMALGVRLSREGRLLAGQSVPLPPGTDRHLELAFPGIGRGPVRLELELVLGLAAPEAHHCGLSVLRPVLEWG